MPPRPQFTRDRIIDTGFDLVREKGWAALSTRAIANRLGSSPIPIYSCFSSIKDLEPEILDRTLLCQQACMNRRFTEDLWHDHGIGYVLFAVEERQLFLGINDEAHFTAARQKGQEIWEEIKAAYLTRPGDDRESTPILTIVAAPKT